MGNPSTARPFLVPLPAQQEESSQSPRQDGVAEPVGVSCKVGFNKPTGVATAFPFLGEGVTAKVGQPKAWGTIKQFMLVLQHFDTDSRRGMAMCLLGYGHLETPELCKIFDKEGVPVPERNGKTFRFWELWNSSDNPDEKQALYKEINFVKNKLLKISR
jgi:hypothetical protein